MNKLAKRLVIFAAAMVMMLASSLTVFAKENEAVPRVVDNVMYVDEGSNNVWIYGVAVSIAGANKTDIVPNNPSTKIDVMANGKVFKQLDGVVLLKDEKKDRVFLEAGSTVIEAPAITDKALATLKKAIADGKADSITAAQVLGTTADKGALAYQIAANGKVVTANGEDMANLLKTNANYKSVMAAYEEAVKAAEEAAKEAAASAPATVASGCGGYCGPVIEYVEILVFNKDSNSGCTVKLLANGKEMSGNAIVELSAIEYFVEKGSSVKVTLERGKHPGEDDLVRHDKPEVIGVKGIVETQNRDLLVGYVDPYATFDAETEGSHIEVIFDTAN